MATTWTEPPDPIGDGARVSKAVCTTGTEAAPATADDVGLLLRGLGAYSVFVESDGAAFTAGQFLRCYLKSPISGKWARRPDMDLTVDAVMNEAFGGFQVEGKVGRLVFLPDGLGQACTVYVVGHYREASR